MTTITGIRPGTFGDKHWRTPVANAAALPSSGNLAGDARKTLDDQHEHVWSGSAWVDEAVAGPQGPVGPAGPTGSQGADGRDGADGADGRAGVVWTSGVEEPSGGVDGDFYLRTSTGDAYERASGTWGVVANLIGPSGDVGPTGAAGASGVDGKTVRNGSGAPSPSLGVDGDFYIDNVAHSIYGPRESGGWGAATSLIGPSGTSTKYSPDAVPEAGMNAVSDEFVGGVGAQWRWANQGGATDVAQFDTALLSVAALAGENHRVRWVTAPAAVSFGVCAKITTYLQTSVNNVGLDLLYGGTEGSPAGIQRIFAYSLGSPSLALHVYSGPVDDYVGTNDRQDADHQVAGSPEGAPHVIYMRWSYVASSKTLGSYWSVDGMTWRFLASVTIPSHPISIGRYVSARSPDSGAAATFHFVRIFDASSGATADQLTGARCGR